MEVTVLLSPYISPVPFTFLVFARVNSVNSSQNPIKLTLLLFILLIKNLTLRGVNYLIHDYSSTSLGLISRHFGSRDPVQNYYVKLELLNHLFLLYSFVIVPHHVSYILSNLFWCFLFCIDLLILIRYLGYSYTLVSNWSHIFIWISPSGMWNDYC